MKKLKNFLAFSLAFIIIFQNTYSALAFGGMNRSWSQPLVEEEALEPESVDLHTEPLSRDEDGNFVLESQAVKEEDAQISEDTTEDFEDTEEFGSDLAPGESRIINYPKTSYRAFDKLDLSGLQVLVKFYDGNVELLSYEDLINDPETSLNLENGTYLPEELYYSLLDEEFLKDESEQTLEEAHDLVRANPSLAENACLYIDFANADPVRLDLEINPGNLSPKELLEILKLENDSIMVLSLDKFTYKANILPDLKQLVLIYKNDKGQIEKLAGKQIESYFEIDLSNLENGLEKIKDPKTGELKEDFEPIDTPILIKENNEVKASLPVSLVDEDFKESSLNKENSLVLSLISKAREGENIRAKIRLDVASLNDLKDLEFEFVDENNNPVKVRISELVETDGRDEKAINIDDEAEELEEKNRLNITKYLKPGKSYILSLDILDNSESLKLKSNYFTKTGPEEKESILIQQEAGKEDKDETEEGPALDEGLEATEDTEISEDPQKEENPEETEDPELSEDPEITEEPEVSEEEEDTESPDLITPQSTPESWFEISDPIIGPALGAVQKVNTKLVINKLDESGNILAGAKFRIYRGPNFDMWQDITLATGSETININERGISYRLVETEAPEGYEKSDKSYLITVDNDGNIWSREETNSISRLANNQLLGSIENDQVLASEQNDFLGPEIDFNQVKASGSELVSLDSYDLRKNKATGDPNTIHVNSGEGLVFDLRVKVADTAKANDSFTIQLDEKLVPATLMPLSPENSPGYFWEPPTISDPNGEIIAKGVYDKENNLITYTFTDFVERNKNVWADINFTPVSANKQKVPFNGSYSFTNKLNGTNLAAKSFTIDYGAVGKSNFNPAFDGKNAFTELNPKEKTFRYVVYANTDGSGPRGTFIDIFERVDGKRVKADTHVNLSTANINVYRIPKTKINADGKNIFVDSMYQDLNALKRAGYPKVTVKDNPGYDNNGAYSRRATTGDTALSNGS